MSASPSHPLVYHILSHRQGRCYSLAKALSLDSHDVPQLLLSAQRGEQGLTEEALQQNERGVLKWGGRLWAQLHVTSHDEQQHRVQN